MPEETTPATPQAGNVGDPQPQAGDPQPTPQAGDGETISLDEAKKLRNEAANLRKRMKAYEEAEAAAKAAQQTNEEKLQAERDELQGLNESLAAELYESRVRQDVADLMGKFDFITGLSAKMIANLLLVDDDAIEFENGKPTNIEKLLEKLVKAEPGLVKPQGGTQDGRPPVTSPNNPGRNNITQPGTQPGKIPTLDEYFRSHR